MLGVHIRIAEEILMSTCNICFYGELTKIILQLSQNTLLICSTADCSGSTLFAILSTSFGPFTLWNIHASESLGYLR